MTVLSEEKELDQEWKELILEAFNLGIPVEKIKSFLNQPITSRKLQQI